MRLLERSDTFWTPIASPPSTFTAYSQALPCLLSPFNLASQCLKPSERTHYTSVLPINSYLIGMLNAHVDGKGYRMLSQNNVLNSVIQEFNFTAR